MFDGVQTTPYTFMLTVNKDNAPTIDGPTDRTVARGSGIAPIEFTIADDFIPAEELTVTAVSSNAAVVRTEDIVLGGTGGTRTIAITPVAGAVGTTTITLTVADDLSSTTHTFDLEVFEPAITYYLSEGSTGAFFDTDLLLANPNDAAVPVTIEFLLPDGAPITLSRELAATSRTTIRADEIEGLESAAFSTVVRSTTGAPIVVERTMRWDAAGYGSHTERASQFGPGLTWYFAEGSQNDFFKTYFLVANPDAEANAAHVTYVRTNEPSLAGQQRLTLDIGAEDPSLVGTAVGTQVVSDLPIVVERSQYWPNPLWHEAHNSGGVTTPGTRWGLAEGRVGGASNDATYVLLANPGTAPVTATLRFLRTNGTTVTKVVPVAATSRVTVGIAGAGSDVPELIDEVFGVTIDATGPIVVERSMYSSVNGVFWSAGTSATATGLPRFCAVRSGIGGTRCS